MSRRRTAVTLSVALALVAAWAAPAGARAEALIMGSSLPAEGQFLCCPMGPDGVLGVQTGQVGGEQPHPIRSPVNGLITSWAVRTNDFGARYSLRVLTPLSGVTYLGSGTASAPSPVPASGNAIYTYPASLPIYAGEAIGLHVAGADGLPVRITTSAVDRIAVGPPMSDNSPGPLPTAYTGLEVLLQATVEFCRVPKLKGIARKKAKNRLRAAGCGVQVKKQKASGKKRGKVIGQKPPKGETVPPGTPVRIFVGR